MNEGQKLHERLLAAGVSQDEAGEICQAFVASEDSGSDSVDVDRLTKAMVGIRDAFDSEEGETADANVNEAIQEASDIVDAVTKGADALLAEQRIQYEALSKAIIALTEEVVELRSNVAQSGDIVSKSMTAVQADLGQPVLRKSIGSMDAIPAPGENVVSSGSDLVSVALTEMQSDGATQNRKLELRKAITLLESGASADQVANSYSLAAHA